ncbi:GAF domain-containing protein [Leeuwenhoekiella sp. W20_SRS_FM14]|uniref:GAF domain-containing protein n=1 Tax=Leeuwenhoekiella sp. W20_SRS_FM14 TaxID=3240270 RepID=UPI003F9CE989
MNEIERLKELLNYHILDTPKEEVFDDLAFLASVICDKPIALIGLLDKDRNWFKAKVGVDIVDSPRDISFCQYTLKNPDEVLVINDTLEDSRFQENPMVIGGPKIRFYAGAPLISPKGFVLGTICVFDTKPGQLNDDKIKSLKLLSKKVMNHFNSRKLLIEQQSKINYDAKYLRQITDYAPGVLFQFELSRSTFSFQFVSKGIKNLHKDIEPELIIKKPEAFLKYVYPSDRVLFQAELKKACLNQSSFEFEFRILNDRGEIQWYLAKGNPCYFNGQKNGWFGSFQNITQQLEYQRAMEQISFDISHILRSPVTNLLGLANLIENEKECLTDYKLREYSHYIQTVSRELDTFTRGLNTIYEQKKVNFQKKAFE